MRAVPGASRFDVLVAPQLDGLLRFARSLARDPIAAEDLVQETLVNAMSRLHTLRDDAAFGVWSHRVMYSTHLDRRVREHRHLRRIEAAGREEQAPAEPPDPGQRVEQHQLGDALAVALNRLPDDQREAVWLVDVEGRTFAETAAILGVKQGTVASRVARGRAALRDDVEVRRSARDVGVIR